MTYHKHESGSNLSIIDAVEALSGIADLDVEHEGAIDIPPPPMEVEGQTIFSQNVEWVQKGDVKETVSRVKEIFHVILNYLRHCYRKESRYVTNHKTIEGIKTIMVLVGEAAKNWINTLHGWRASEHTVSLSYLNIGSFRSFIRRKLIRKLMKELWVNGFWD